jgi:predicted nuclease of predicted toxin-antitoxin system
MRLKLDENLSRHLKPLLADLGHDVLTAAEEDLLSRPDVEVAACAARERRILLTLDVEFADLRKYPPGSHPGIVLFRPISLGPLSVNRFVERFARSTDLSGLSGCIAVVDPQGIRVRQPKQTPPGIVG